MRQVPRQLTGGHQQGMSLDGRWCCEDRHQVDGQPAARRIARQLAYGNRAQACTADPNVSSDDADSGSLWESCRALSSMRFPAFPRRDGVQGADEGRAEGHMAREEGEGRRGARQGREPLPPHVST